MNKRVIIGAIALCTALTLTSCTAYSETDTDVVAESKTEAVDETSSALDSMIDNKKVSAQSDVGENGAKAVTHVELIPDDNIDISDKVTFTDMYGKHVLHSGVVGLIGAPLEIKYDEKEIKSATLVFTYDKNKLEGNRPDSLMFLWYDEENNNYEEMQGETLDTDKCTVTLPIDKSGTYMLVNKYKWYNAWGADIKDYGLDPDYDPNGAELSSETWESNAYTGDILKLVDMEYIKKSVSTDNIKFKVSTPEQLASAVYYVNCAPNTWSSERPRVDIVLENDIDLKGIKWAPMGWRSALDYGFSGEVHGQGHTIKNMTIDAPNDSAAFVGYSSYGRFYNLKFKNAKVKGSLCAVIVAEDYCCHLENCYCYGTVDGSQAGSICGQSSRTDYIDCSCKVKVNGKEYSDSITHSELQAKKIAAKHKPTETISVNSGKVIHRDSGLETKYEDLGWRVTYNGEQILDRNAENETDFHIIDYYTQKGEYTVTLTAFVEGCYIPISNTVKFKID